MMASPAPKSLQTETPETKPSVAGSVPRPAAWAPRSPRMRAQSMSPTGETRSTDASRSKRTRARSRSGSPPRQLQDAWVEGLRRQDAASLRAVVEAFADRLSAVVAGLLGDHQAVEDVVQETFVKAYQRIHNFHGRSSLYTWLYRIAVNGAKDHIKSRRRRPARSLDDFSGRGSLEAGSVPALEGLAKREQRMLLRAGIEALPDRFRRVLVLREIEGMSYQDIAEVLGLTLGTVESKIFRARKRLRAHMMRTRPRNTGSELEGSHGP